MKEMKKTIKAKAKKEVNKEPEVTPKTKKKLKFKMKNIWAILLMLGIAGVTLVLIFALYIIITAPEFNRDKLYAKEPTIIYYADGTEMTRYGSENRVLVTYDDLPQVLVDAIVATEDSRFFQHTGLDVARFSKAIIGQLLGDKKAGGASTLSMQVIKQDYTDKNQDEGITGIIRKFTDVYMAIFKLESNYTKEEIMEFYVNTMWFSGENNSYVEKGIAGVEQASQYFFGKSVSDLTLAEASILAGMFQNPSYYNPYRFPDRLTTRQNTVLKLMVQHGYITEQEKEDVQKIPISSLLVSHTNEVNNGSNQAVVDYIIEDVSTKTGKNPYTTPMKIYSTVNKKVQEVVNQFEKGELTKKEYYDFYKKEYIDEGVAITSTENGSIVALSGGRNYQGLGLNNATGIVRQPGSAAKIFMDYGPYLEAFPDASPASLFLDRPTTYSDGTSIVNADRTYLGLITMRTALSNSRNIPALLAFQAVVKEKGEKYISDFVHSIGISYGNNLYESASIGGFDGVSPLQMSAAYASFGRGGYYIEPYSFTKVEYVSTGNIYEYKYEKKKVMSEQTAYMITDILMTAFKSGIAGRFSVSGTDVAAKTGTPTIDSKYISDHGLPQGATRDAWNMVYTSEYTIGMWLGIDKVTKTQYLTVTTGGNYRTAAMRSLAPKVLSKNKKFTKPSDLVSVTIENETYPSQLASSFTPSDLKITEIFREGAQPQEESARFAKLANPTNGSAKFDGTTLTLTWNPIAKPSAIDTNYLSEFFNKNYGKYANEYYEKRINYNNNYIGTLGYQIYLKNADGTLTYLGRTETNSYQVTNPTNGNNTYVIKSAYSKFSANMSDGLNIIANTQIDSNVDDIIDGKETDTDTDKPVNDTTPSTDLDS